MFFENAEIISIQDAEELFWKEVDYYYRQQRQYEETRILIKTKPQFFSDQGYDCSGSIIAYSYLLVESRAIRDLFPFLSKIDKDSEKAAEKYLESFHRKEVVVFRLQFSTIIKNNKICLSSPHIRIENPYSRKLLYNKESLKRYWEECFLNGRYLISNRNTDILRIQTYLSSELWALSEIASKEYGYNVIDEWEKLVPKMEITATKLLAEKATSLTSKDSYEREQIKERLEFLNNHGPKLIDHFIKSFEKVNKDYSQFRLHESILSYLDLSVYQ